MNMIRYRQNQWPSLFRDVFGDSVFAPLFDEEGKTCCAPVVDVHEKEGTLTFEAELPGIRKDDIKVEYTDGVLSISGEKKVEEEEKKGSYYSRERCFGTFSRSYRVGDAYDPKSISAKFADGVLTVTVLKKAETRPISVKIV